MSLFRRTRVDQGTDQGIDERSIGHTVKTLEDLGIAIAGSGQVSVHGAQNIDTALQHPTVWRSVNKIASMYVQMPTKARSGNRVVSPQPPVLVRPSAMYRLSAWKRSAVTSMLLKGGVYGLTSAPDARGQATSCELIHPDRVTWTERDGWKIDNEPAPPEWPLGNFWQVPLMTLPGSPKGVNPIEYARRTTYAGMAASEFGGNFFRDGAHPTTIIQPEQDPGADGAAVLKAKVKKATSGTSREPLVLPQSVKWHQIQINPDDSQFIELMQFSNGQLAGFFGLDPSHVGLPVEGGSMDYSNRENRQQDILQDAVMQVVIPLDEALSELVLSRQEVLTSPAGLLRADLLTRYKSYAISAKVQKSTGYPIVSGPEWRDLEDREPFTEAELAEFAAWTNTNDENDLVLTEGDDE